MLGFVINDPRGLLCDPLMSEFQIKSYHFSIDLAFCVSILSLEQVQF